ncbi:MAG: MFS transporter [Caldisericia bacterium]|nr:MFS transporter [Caldisericia bacterium]MDD4614637.1 MFS transporter [Caldisericia bacterium]
MYSRSFNRNFKLFSAGRMVSLIGSGIQALALSLYILDLTGSGSKMGTFLIFSLLPRVLFSPLAGIIGDRMNRKSIMVAMDILRGIVILIMALISGLYQLQILHIYLFQFVVSILDTFFDPVTTSMLPEIVQESELTKANSVLGAINSISYIIGPILGGVLYPLGIEVVFIINGTSFFLSGVSEVFIVYTQSTQRVKMTLQQVWTDFAGGIRYFTRQKSMTSVMFFAMITNFLAVPIIMVVVPFFAREVVGFTSTQYGFMETAWVIGMLIGNLLIATIFSKKKIQFLFQLGIWGQMGFLFLFSLITFPFSVQYFGGASWSYLVVVSLCFVIIGLFNAYVNTPLSVYFQKAVPSEMRTRVFSVMSILSQLIVPLGIAIYGFLTDLYPSHLIIIVSWFITFIVVLLFFLRKTFYSFEDVASVECT